MVFTGEVAWEIGRDCVGDGFFQNVDGLGKIAVLVIQELVKMDASRKISQAHTFRRSNSSSSGFPAHLACFEGAIAAILVVVLERIVKFNRRNQVGVAAGKFFDGCPSKLSKSR